MVRNGEGALHDEVGQLKASDLIGDMPWGQRVDGGSTFLANMSRVSAAPEIGDMEVWHFRNGGNGWSHNVHVHFEEGRILSRDGEPPPEWEKWARKDVYRVCLLYTSPSPRDA